MTNLYVTKFSKIRIRRHPHKYLTAVQKKCSARQLYNTVSSVDMCQYSCTRQWTWYIPLCNTCIALHCIYRVLDSGHGTFHCVIPPLHCTVFTVYSTVDMVHSTVLNLHCIALYLPCTRQWTWYIPLCNTCIALHCIYRV